VGRGDLIRAALAALAVAGVAVLAAPVAQAGPQWRLVTTGKTVPVGARAPEAFLTTVRSEEARWFPRLTPQDRVLAGKVDVLKTVPVAVFLDGLPCASGVEVAGVTRLGDTLTVWVAYSRPRVGVAACIRTSVSYAVVAITRRSLGAPPPTRVKVAAHARA
jgi:hypothetical protein